MSSPFAGDIEFHKLLAGQTDVDLPRLMLEFAADAYPQLDESVSLAELDRLGRLAAMDLARLPGNSSLEPRLAAVSRLLYEAQGFHGNDEQYYDPRNSYLNEVLTRRTGIPISLGILYLSVAARAGLRLFGVNTPGHFVLGCRGGGELLFVDPFSSGEVLDRQGCKQRVEEVLGEQHILGDEHLRPAPPRDIVARVLRNLKAAFALENNWPGALSAQVRLAALLPRCVDEQRDLGLIYLRAGQPNMALPLLELSLGCCGSEHADLLRASVRTARKLVAEMN